MVKWSMAYQDVAGLTLGEEVEHCNAFLSRIAVTTKPKSKAGCSDLPTLMAMGWNQQKFDNLAISLISEDSVDLRTEEEQKILVAEMDHHWKSLSACADALGELSCLLSNETMKMAKPEMTPGSLPANSSTSPHIPTSFQHDCLHLYIIKHPSIVYFCLYLLFFIKVFAQYPRFTAVLIIYIQEERARDNHIDTCDVSLPYTL
ncbi:uncharacterized protein [Misgurnus anguillicaudatus]|uniref:uncharacterized protein n=1 Tax=Misgurnus anguillicaudatus TaxID=75329 RepID=UPI003CCFAFD2